MDLNVYFGKTNVIVIGVITINSLSIGKVEPYVVYSLIVEANSAFCGRCDKWIYGSCAGVKRVTTKFLKNCACSKC